MIITELPLDEKGVKPYARPQALGPDLKMHAAVIVDIDGTVALHNGRGPFEYEKLHDDLPNVAVIETISALYRAGFDVIFLSGRPNEWFVPTVRWILNHIPNVPEFEGPFMRRTGDYREDFVIKRELYDKNVKDRYHVLGVFDDRDQVVRMWREDLGFTCFQVAYGDF